MYLYSGMVHNLVYAFLVKQIQLFVLRIRNNTKHATRNTQAVGFVLRLQVSTKLS